MGYTYAQNSKKVLILTMISESHAMINHFSNFLFYDETLIGNFIILHSAYARLAKYSLREPTTPDQSLASRREAGLSDR